MLYDQCVEYYASSPDTIPNESHDIYRTFFTGKNYKFLSEYLKEFQSQNETISNDDMKTFIQYLRRLRNAAASKSISFGRVKTLPFMRPMCRSKTSDSDLFSERVQAFARFCVTAYADYKWGDDIQPNVKELVDALEASGFKGYSDIGEREEKDAVYVIITENLKKKLVDGLGATDMFQCFADREPLGEYVGCAAYGITPGHSSLFYMHDVY